jgi:hypothetical protein
MPKHYEGDKKKDEKKPKITKEQHKKFLKAEKDGLITKKQYQNLSAGLLEGIIKKKKNGMKEKK